MTSILIRTAIVYTCLLIAIRLMGKRQIGQLEVTDFVTTLLISEIASLPIESPDIPISFALVPIITLVTFEVASSTILSRSQLLKNLFSSRPSFLISNGIFDQKELKRNRISLDELISELRQQGANDISEIKYAILEQDGHISVILKAKHQPPTLSDLKIKTQDKGIAHIIIANGRANSHGLRTIKKDRRWLDSVLKRNNMIASDVYLMTSNDNGEINIVRKE